ncbi:MAG TPA: Ig-like domain-containing protein, partial [Solirubrobacterales bacterium]|nr:Ig-like domain-containing protein [Solirubrobacterales bacterium]
MVVFALLLLGGQGLLAESAIAAPCDPPVQAVACENTKAGSPPSEWDVSGGGDSDIQGFATDISVDQGGTVQFKVDTPSTDYRLDVYRMGYYAGNGARKVATVQPSASLPQSQPLCAEEAATGLIDCGTWAVSASWAVPASAVSGIYFAKLVREDQASGGSHVMFVVRDDDGGSDLLFQTSDSTWQAYNRYGGRSLYAGGPGINPARAYAVSYNRPLTVRGPVPEDSPFNAEYPMVRWLERNGYDVSYSTDVDSDRRGTELLEHEAFLSVGHDEYWSGQQRTNVAAARDAGVDLAFFSGNELFWKTRWRNSIGGPSTPYRTLVSYKETHANSKIDPEPNVWTGTWRDPRFTPPADGGRQENELSGTAFAVNAGTTEIVVPAEDGQMRMWRDTSVASLTPGQTATLGEDTLGYEWDEAPADETRPAGLIHLASRTVNVSQKLLDYGSTYGSGPVTHHLTQYRAPSDALVFSAGTIQWSWGLDGVHDRGATTPDSRMQQATVNLLADMGAQPNTLQAGLVAAAQSTDDEAPTATIASPADGGDVEVGQPMTISGSAADAAGEGGGDGAVGAVEVSVDGGETWLPAEGRESWTYSWTPEDTGEETIMARAVDDSGNIQAPGDVAEVDVVEGACPCTIWDSSFTGPQDSDKGSIEVGLKFRADTTGFITGIRFYKTAGNTGTHAGRLWTLGGTQLGVANFSGETATGWQQASFGSPIPINAGATYVASYHAPNGRYSSITGYFSVVGVDNPPLHALANGVDGPNGIFKYGAAGSLFSSGGPSTFNAENYLVDVVFEDELLPDTTPPQISSRSPVGGSTDISTDIDVSATFDEPMNAATIDGARVELRDPSNNLVPATVSYDAGQRTATLDPSASLQQATTYTAKVKGGPGGVADVAGNPLAATSTWSFTTVPPPPPPPDEGPGGPILVISNTANPFSRYYGEILRAEGLNEFTITDIANVTPALLGNHDVAILAEGALSAAQATTLGNWVQAGGNLISMRPDSDLVALLGLTSAGSTLGNAYLQVNTGSSPGAGIVGQTIQFHGIADRYTLNGAQSVATLYSNASTATANPAVTLRSVGSNGGQAAAFTYDLARSIVYTRQGNPAWSGQERDGLNPVRSDDLFFGAKAGDTQPDWVDLNKVAIPQADEQQRLLTNLIGQMNLDRKPLPRFWFLPRDEMAAVVMTGDDHAHNGTQGRFEHFKTLDPPGCVVADWECVRASSYIYPDTPITNTKAGQLAADGFEVALHAWTNCENWDDQEDLEDKYTEQLEAFATAFPSLPAPTTNRTHCIVWSDWATQPKVELGNGIRLDTTYYYWPEGWVQNRPGMFTGSGMPMRFADLDGSMIDVYQAATQMTDESKQTYPFTSNELLDRALGPEGYYGVFTANIHTDKVASVESDAIIASAQARGVPVVSARQMLTWLDGRNQSSFESIGWSGDELEFEIDPGAGANGLRAMVPTNSATGPLASIDRGGTPVTTTTRTVKGVEYAFFDAVAGSYTATYADDSFPVISNVQVTAGGDGTATVTWNTNEPADSRVDYGTNPSSLTSSKSSSALVTSHSIQLSGLEPGLTYHFRVSSADSEANSSTTPKPPTAPQSFATPPGPPTLSATVPASPANQNAPKVVGSAAAGSTVRIYTTSDCSGSPLATASAATLTTGIEVAVADNTTTNFRATATSAAGTSTCSAPLAYVEDSNAPLTQIDSGPTALTTSAVANFTFSGSDPGGAGVSFQCRLDSTAPAAWVPCTSPRELTGMSEGAHTFEVRAIDAAGNADASPASFTWTVDSAAPQTQIDSKPPVTSTSAIANFTFSGSDPGGSGVASLQCRVDSTAPGAWAPCSSPRELTGLSEGPHTFEVRAIDQAGNTDATPAAFNWTVDTVAPNTTIDSKPPALSNSATANFTFSGTDPGGSGVASFQCRLDSTAPGAWTSCTSPRELTGLGEGSHTFEVRAVDQASNADASPASFTWNVDSVAPQTQIDTKPPALSTAATANFTFSGSDTGGSGVASFQCRLDSTAPGAWAACTSPWELTGLSEGAHTFEVRAVDTAGNTDTTPASFTWAVDTIAPDTTIGSSPPALSNSATANFTFSGSDPAGSGIASFQCRLDSTAPGAWATCASPRELTGLGQGPHTFEVRAVDQVGNIDQSPASFTWTVDTAAPSVSIDSGPSGFTPDSTPTFAFSSEPGASFACSVDTGIADFKPCSAAGSHTPAAPLADGPYTFRVKATDAAGNPATATRGFTVDSKAPETQIDSQPDPVSTSTTANFTFSGTDPGGSGVASFQCRRDSNLPEDWQPCSSPRKDTSLAEGAHSFEVRAIDAAGNVDPSPASFTWTIDTVAPDTAIGSNPPALSNSAAAQFGFTGSDPGGSSVASFQCRRDSTAPGAWEGCTSPKDYASLADGAHSFEVRAIDQAGNVDATPASFNWTVDTGAPNTTIGSSPPALSNSATANFIFSGSDTGGSGVASFQCRLDSTAPGAWTSCTSPRELTGLSEGAHTFEVRAIDQAGNADASPASFTWTVDTATPQTQVDTGPPALTNSTSAQFAFTGSDPGGSGVAAFQCRLDSTSPGAWSACGSPKDLTGLGEGPHTFEVRAVDQAGNADASPASFTWTVDGVAPQTQINSAPPALSISAGALFIFSGSDPGGSGVASFQCRLDSTAPGAWEACTSPKDYASLIDGAHTFEVRAVDQAGNPDQSPATHTWTVDSVAPTVSIDSGPSGLTNDSTPTFAFSSEPGASFACSIDTGTADFKPCSGTGTHTPAAPLADGPYTLRVKATDAAGNPATATRSFTVDTAAPPVPQLSATVPPSPANDNTPQVAGAAPASTTVRLYATADCSGDPLATVTAAQLAAGVEVTVADDTTTAFRATATSGDNNVSLCSAPLAYVEDSSAPQTQIDASPPALTSNMAAQFAFSGSDPGGSGVALFECRLDSTAPGSWVPCVSPRDLTGLGEGSHTFEVRAIDQAGNTDASPATHTWTVDTTAPSVSVDSGPSGLTNDSTPTFAFSSEPGASFQCSVDAGIADFKPCSDAGSHTPASPLADGPYTFRVKATDAAGNPATATRSFTVETAAPAAPQLNATVPPSPASDNTPQITGSAPAGTTVRLYSTADCSGTPIATVTPAQLASGVEVSVADDSTTAFRATATSGANNTSVCSAALTYVEDSAAPQTQIDSNPPALSNSAAASFAFSGTDPGGSGVTSLQCRLDSTVPGAWTICTSPRELVGLSEGAHTFEVRATDAAGNVDPTPATYGWSVDLAAPTTAIDTNPPALSNSAVANFAFSGTDPAGSGVASFQCRLDSTAPGAWGACTPPKELTGLSEGDHTFEVRAVDQAGNIDQSPATHTWTVDTVAPNTAIDSNPPALSNSAAASFAFSGTDAGGSGVASFQCRLDSTAPGAWAACTSPQELTGLSEGSHTFEVRVVDTAGNADASPASFTWKIDTISPNTAIDTNPPALSNSTTANFAFTGFDTGGSGVASLQCRLDSSAPGAWAACTSPRELTGLAEGSHTFEVRTVDQADNTDASPATQTWTVDTTAPTVSIDSGASGLTNDSTPAFAFSSEAGASFQCSIDTGTADFKPCSAAGSHTPAAPLADGPYAFRVQATDAAGNPATATRSFTVDTAAPASPQLTATVPASPANDNTPQITGTAPAGTTVRLFSTTDCAGDPLATVTPAQLETGVEVAVADDSTTSFRATATSGANNVSACSAPVVYVEDSSAPQTQIDSNPPALSSSPAANFAFSGSDVGGSGIASFQCRLDLTAPGAWEACTSPKDYASLIDGAHTFEVRAVDQAGNTDQSPATHTWTVDTTAPTVSVDSGPSGLTNDSTPTFAFSSE